MNGIAPILMYWFKLLLRKMLTLGEAGWGICGNSLYCFYKFFVSK